MNPRITPRQNTPTTITVTPTLAAGQVVTIAVNNQNANNGTVQVGGAATVDVTKTGPINLKGVTQTKAAGAGNGGANAGNLKLVARVRGEDTIQSTGFSVAAIAINFTSSLINKINNAKVWGLHTQDGWASDSGNIADLDQVFMSEQVEVTKATGVTVHTLV